MFADYYVIKNLQNLRINPDDVKGVPYAFL